MADVRVILRECDIRGAILPCSVVEDNQTDDLRRWISCRGFTAGKSESKSSLVRRVKDLVNSGLSRHVCDPDGEATSKFIPKESDVPLPPANKWTSELGCIPGSFTHQSLVEYLVHRKIRVIAHHNASESDAEEEEEHIDLPTAQKPLRKGYNFYASGHVDEIKTNVMENFVHVSAKVLSSFKENRYDTRVVLDLKTGEIIKAVCGCVVGKGGKCNHVAGLLFAMLDFNTSLQLAPDSCTNKSQKWHKPPRKSKRFTRPMPAGDRKLHTSEYGRIVKRKRPLQDYKNYKVLTSAAVTDLQVFALKRSLSTIKAEKHDIGLTQILDSSTDTASEVETIPIDTGILVHLTPEEKVMSSLQVTKEGSEEIELKTRGQANNPRWHRERKGRITASNAKRCCGTPSISIIKTIIVQGKPRKTSIPSLRYGIDNEVVAADKYLQVKKDVQYSLKECGIFVCTPNGQLAASPDRLVCDADGSVIGLLEVKCLYSCRELCPKAATSLKQNKSDFPVKEIPDAQYMLKTKHSYYYQVQMQMAICHLPWCDFVLFTNSDSDCIIIRVEFDEEFWEDIQAKLLSFHEDHIMPALVAQGFSQ